MDEFDQAIAELDALKKFAADVQADKELLALSERLEQERTKFDETIPKAMVMKERDEVRPTFILQRGQYDAPGREVSRNTPSLFASAENIR